MTLEQLINKSNAMAKRKVFRIWAEKETVVENEQTFNTAIEAIMEADWLWKNERYIDIHVSSEEEVDEDGFPSDHNSIWSNGCYEYDYFRELVAVFLDELKLVATVDELDDFGNWRFKGDVSVKILDKSIQLVLDPYYGEREWKIDSSSKIVSYGVRKFVINDGLKVEF